MATQISWHKFAWGYNGRRICSVDDLKTNRSVDVERNEDKEGQPATQTVAMALASVSFSYNVASGAGGNPYKEWQEIKDCIGVHAPLFLNGKRFPVKELMLKSVDASDWVLDGKGRAVSVNISLQFEEYAVDASGLKLSKITKNSALKPGLQTAPPAASALNVGATSAQKASRTAKNPQMSGW